MSDKTTKPAKKAERGVNRMVTVLKRPALLKAQKTAKSKDQKTFTFDGTRYNTSDTFKKL